MSVSVDAPGSTSRTRVLVLLGVGTWSTVAIAGAALVLAIAALLWGLGALGLHEHFVELRERGQALGAFPGLLADSSTLLTALTGWLAAACFGFAAWQVRRGDPEPPARSGEATSVSELRAGLRREFTMSRVLLDVVLIITVLDIGRLTINIIARAGGTLAAGDALGLVAVECAGLVMATTALMFWTSGFRKQLEQVGAL
ncbi:MAG: hypothetical protein ACR2GX_00285 [Candidatus Dormibacteria bacterium]